MGKRFLLSLIVLLMAGTMCCRGQGPFCGAVGTPGCNAVSFSSNAIIGWATSCTVVRGPVNIVDPDGPRVRYGKEEYGVGPASRSTTQAVSLGDGGTATLTFDGPIHNVEGPDFAVFENPFDNSFLELAFVEVSTDGERYVRFPSTSLTPTDVQTGPNGSTDPTMINNLAGKFKVGYGTPFDLEELRDSVGIDIDSIVYVRLVDVVGTVDPQYATYDAFGHMVNDPYPTADTVFASGGFDLTGVAVLRSTLGIEMAEEQPVSVYPNPSREKVVVCGDEGVEARLYNLQGRYVLSLHVSSNGTEVDISMLPAGVYVLRLGSNAVRIIKT